MNEQAAATERRQPKLKNTELKVIECGVKVASKKGHPNKDEQNFHDGFSVFEIEMLKTK